jgi:uncharacterized glyoxalase superfamily protein PhnB
MESISPNIFVKDMDQTIEFYKILGFELLMTVPEKGKFDWAMMKNGNVNFMFQTFSSIGDSLPDISRNEGGSLLLYIQLKNIRSFFESVKDRVSIVSGLEKTFYGATEFSIKDNNGYILTFAEDEKS